MEKENINFVAIDFETMTPELTSACAVGMVQVVNGVIMQKFYSLIKPYLMSVQSETHSCMALLKRWWRMHLLGISFSQF